MSLFNRRKDYRAVSGTLVNEILDSASSLVSTLDQHTDAFKGPSKALQGTVQFVAMCVLLMETKRILWESLISSRKDALEMERQITRDFENQVDEFHKDGEDGDSLVPLSQRICSNYAARMSNDDKCIVEYVGFTSTQMCDVPDAITSFQINSAFCEYLKLHYERISEIWKEAK